MDRQYKNIIFLDIDGVLNCQLFYEQRDKSTVAENHPYSQICSTRVKWLNDLCDKVDAGIVISSTWRFSGIDYCTDALTKQGATFDIIDITPHTGYERGTEIAKWLRANSEKYLGKTYYDCLNYAIIDDDSDMLLSQARHLFLTDNYSGLTPNTCYKIERFLSGQMVI